MSGSSDLRERFKSMTYDVRLKDYNMRAKVLSGPEWDQYLNSLDDVQENSVAVTIDQIKDGGTPTPYQEKRRAGGGAAQPDTPAVQPQALQEPSVSQEAESSAVSSQEDYKQAQS